MDLNFTLDQLRVLLAVVDTGSFTAAAKRLRRSQGAISYNITALEELARRDAPVALVLSDHRMPEMTGIELLDRVRFPGHASGQDLESDFLFEFEIENLEDRGHAPLPQLLENAVAVGNDLALFRHGAGRQGERVVVDVHCKRVARRIWVIDPLR